MTRATERLHPRIAVVFDFDLTIAPGCLDALLRRCGENPDDWRRSRLAPLQNAGWEEILASVHLLATRTDGSGEPITWDLVREVGRNLKPYEGVADIFDSLRRTSAEVDPDIAVEFFIVSSGYYDIMCETCIAGAFKSIWGTKLHFGEDDGRLVCAKLVVTHPEKVRYLLALSKGLDPTGPNAPSHVFRSVPTDQIYVPLDQIVYVGDGRSDMSVFQLMADRGGLAIGLFKNDSEDWNGLERVDSKRHVQNLARADFTPGSELMSSMHLAVGSIARKIALRALSSGE